MSVFGGLEDNAPDGSMYIDPGDAVDHAWSSSHDKNATESGDLSQAEPGEQQTLATESSSIKPVEQEQASTTHSDENYPKDDNVAATSDAPSLYDPESKKRRKRLIISVTAIEQTKSEPIVWLDVTTSLARFRNTSYRDVRRTHHELQRFANHLASANPECFVPALPPSTNSYPAGSAESSEQLRQNLQKWFDRITRSPLLARDEEFLYFVEATTGYVPIVKINPPATGLARKMIKQLQPPPDQVEELRDFRPQAKLLYEYSQETKSRLDKVSKCRKNLGASLGELGQTLLSVNGSSGAEVVDQNLEPMCQGIGKAFIITADAESGKALAEDTTFGDTLTIVSKDAFIIKETLTNRHLLMRDLLKAQHATEEKHAKATRLKGSTNISPSKVDEAITQLESAAYLEKRITSTVRRVSDNLLVEKKIVLSRLESDILESISNYVLKSIDQERRTLSAWEHVRPDVRSRDPNGGLSRLGRTTVNKSRTHSQSFISDEWSDRPLRAKDMKPVAQGKPEVLDMKSAASMLSEAYL